VAGAAAMVEGAAAAITVREGVAAVSAAVVANAAGPEVAVEAVSDEIVSSSDPGAMAPADSGAIQVVRHHRHLPRR